MNKDEAIKTIRQIEILLRALEEQLGLGNSTKTLGDREKRKTEAFAGPKGGILLLIERGFLKTKNTVDIVKKELEKEGYIYKREVIQTALNRLSNSKGPLVKIDEGGKKAYVQRK
jgi:hypothetical protein